VHLALDTDADFLRQGMTISATITTATRPDALVAGNDLLRNVRGNQADVLRVINNRVETAAVTLGLRGMVASEILSGLAAGDTVLAAEAETGSRVRVELQDRLATGGD
jgi:HlyD family secretion protein